MTAFLWNSKVRKSNFISLIFLIYILLFCWGFSDFHTYNLRNLAKCSQFRTVACRYIHKMRICCCRNCYKNLEFQLKLFCTLVWILNTRLLQPWDSPLREKRGIRAPLKNRPGQQIFIQNFAPSQTHTSLSQGYPFFFLIFEITLNKEEKQLGKKGELKKIGGKLAPCMLHTLTEHTIHSLPLKFINNTAISLNELSDDHGRPFVRVSPSIYTPLTHCNFL